MKKQSFITALIVLLVGASCSPKGEPETPPAPAPQDTVPAEPTDPDIPKDPEENKVDSFYLEDMTPYQSGRHESYRPQIHYTPAQNWINDPNGLVYRDGTWHLCYQYNPYGNGWGFMSWGHATSTDLVHWTEQSVALLKDDLGDVFSGSSVVDFDNRAGFGENAIISYYTAAGSSGQQQAMAYSTDGITWSREGIQNPIIPNPLNDDNCRDPKVFYDQAHDQYVMTLAHGWHMGAEIWVSQDMKNWTLTDSVNYDIPGRPRFQWECPDLVWLTYRDDPSRGEWVMIVSLNPGGPVTGSGTMYLLGDWDGAHFTVRDDNYPLWLDYGTDNYAGVTWSNTPDNRKILIGWMSNWNYASLVPCTPWCSALTVPRELQLVEYKGKPRVASLPVHEMDDYAGEWKEWPIQGDTLAVMGNPAAYELEVTIPTHEDVTLTFRTRSNQKMDLYYFASTGNLMLNRSNDSGVMPDGFKQMMTAPSHAQGSELTLRIVVDQSSMEIYTADGMTVLTALCFPYQIYHQILRQGAVVSCRTRTFESIWN